MCFAAVVFICVIFMFLNSMQCTNDLTSNYTNDAIKIMNAIETDKLGSDLTIINILVARSNEQRQEIKKAFKNHYRMDLVRELKRHFYYDLKEAITALMIPNQKFYAYQIHLAIDGLGTDENAISQILGSMNETEIANVSTVYENEYGVTLKDDLISDTSGPYMNLLVALCDAVRDGDDIVDNHVAVVDAKALYDACKFLDDKYRADETVFIKIFTTRSHPQLAITFQEYSKITNKTIEETIKKEFMGELQYALLIIVRNASLSKPQFYAAQLEESMAGYGTDDHQLIRIVVGRSEIDLDEIKEEYKNTYGTPLIDRVDDETSGKYRNLLLAILRK